MGLSQFDEKSAVVATGRILNAAGTTKVLTYSPASQLARLDGVVLTNNDVIAHVVEVILSGGGIDAVLGSASIPAGQGFNNSPGLDILALALPPTVTGLVISSAYTFALRLQVAATLTNEVDYSILGGLL